MRDTTNVFCIFEGQLLDRSKLEEVMAKMVEKVQQDEPGTLDYEWTVSEDGKQCAFHERYASSEAMHKHVQGFGDFAAAFLAAVKPTRFTIYGEVSEALKSTLEGFTPTYFRRIGGFVR